MYIIRWNYSFLEDYVSEDIELLKRIVKEIYPDAEEHPDADGTYDETDESVVFIEGLKERAWVHEVAGVTEMYFNEIVKELKNQL